MNRTDFQQFYVAPENVDGETFRLEGEEYRHAIKVLRKSIGDKVSAVDGLGNLYVGRIAVAYNDHLVVTIEDKQENVGEPDLRLSLAAAVLKGGHFDLIIEKGVELGVCAFLPLITERTIARPDSRPDRWRKKAIAAMKQCGRTRCPDVLEPLRFAEALNQVSADKIFIAHEAVSPSKKPLMIPEGVSSAVVLIGPEGGFTEEEVALAAARGALPLSLGPRRLRAETAALVAATKILAAAGELS